MAGHRLADLNVTLELPSNEAVLAAVRASGCVSVLSERSVAAAIAAGWVVGQALEGGARSFSVLTHPERHRTRAAALVLDALA